MVDIGNGSGSFLTAFGYEPFSANNILNTNVFQVSDNFDVYIGKHSLTFGTYNEFYQFENGFDPFYYGAYQFNSLADFYASAEGTVGKIKQYQLGYAANETGDFPLVKISPYQLGLYAQDKYDLNDNFNVTVGIRVDMPVINASIERNVAAAGFTFRDGAHVYTDKVQKSSVLLSPRIGFNWDVKGNGNTQLRGGSGIFTGRVPYVWISNQASNNGLLFGSTFLSTVNAATYTFSPDVDAYRPGKNGNPPASASSTYNLATTSSNFKFPQVWRTNIAVDQKLPGGIIASLDIAYTQDMNAVYHRNINLPNATYKAEGADNRPIFYPSFPTTGNSNSTANTRLNPTVTDAILMSNTSKGYSYFITPQLKKSFAFGLDAMIAYNYTDSRSVNDGGSIAQSIWRDRQVSGDPNNNVLGYSSYLQNHRVILSLNYHKEYARYLGTTIGIFYEAGPAGRFSYTYAGDMNGDNSGGGGNDLIYVPRTQSEIALLDIDNGDGTFYTAQQQWNDLDAYINQDKYLNSRRGHYAERNGAQNPWRGQLDLRILQDFFIKTANGKRNTLQLSLDIFNVANMISSDWGVLQVPNRSNLITFMRYDANRVPQFTYPYLNSTTKERLTKTFQDNYGLTSRWQMQFGVRYIFN